jgi:hypothetical protein
MGIYCKGEFTDDAGYDWLVEIHDTTYSSTQFTMQLNSFVRTYDGTTNKPLLEPIYSSKVKANILITENDPAIEALIADIANGKEDQFYMVIKREGVLWFAGMILTDLCQYDDMQRFYFELTASDGMNRLENFDFPIDDFATDYITELEAILAALQICGIERFYTTDVYLKSGLNWYEVNSDRAGNNPLEITRIRLDSLYDDIDEGRPKRAKQVIEDILKTYGATLRYDNGTWWILQPENINGTNVPTTYFQKDGTSLGAFSVANTYTIDTGGYKTNDVIVNMYLPSLYGVGVTYEGNSEYRWGRNENVPFPSRLNNTVPIKNDVAKELQFSTKFFFSPVSAGPSQTFKMYVVPRCGDWVYINDKGLGRNRWAYLFPGLPFPMSVFGDWIYYEIKQETIFTQNIEFSLNIDKPVLGVGAEDEIVFDLTLIDGITSARVPDGWTSQYCLLSEQTNGEDEFKQSFVANNSVYNAASMFDEEKVAYCDTQTDFVLGAKQVFNGTDWIPSDEWAAGTSATSGTALMTLLASKCIYWQRYPRLLIQGTLLLPEYNSVNTLIWRGTRFMMMNGTFDARTRSWNGVWVEMLEQTSDVVVASRNPYRNPLLQASDNGDQNWGQIGRIGNYLNQLQSQVFELQSTVNDLKLKSDAGLEQQLIQNIQGVETSMSIGEKQPLQITKTSTGYKLEYGTVG